MCGIPRDKGSEQGSTQGRGRHIYISHNKNDIINLHVAGVEERVSSMLTPTL